MIRFRTVTGVARLAGRVIETATIEPQDIPEVLSLVNAHTVSTVGRLFCDHLNGEPNKGFAITDRGYDLSVRIKPGYPTVFIEMPSGVTIKVGCHKDVDAILDTDA
ncbi:hypothetical protein Lepto7375DRAFT_7306 [Leptolyngbya sp. PCC 7375]|nr:hypothetical protein Lepto7375DRAFT_7306 [Leptolyngbya sp. PCC 7375]